MFKNIKARFGAKRFNVLTEREDPNSKGPFWIYNGEIYVGHPLFIFFKSESKSRYFH